jgi:hypothetical protein
MGSAGHSWRRRPAPGERQPQLVEAATHASTKALAKGGALDLTSTSHGQLRTHGELQPWVAVAAGLRSRVHDSVTASSTKKEPTCSFCGKTSTAAAPHGHRDALLQHDECDGGRGTVPCTPHKTLCCASPARAQAWLDLVCDRIWSCWFVYVREVRCADGFEDLIHGVRRKWICSMAWTSSPSRSQQPSLEPMSHPILQRKPNASYMCAKIRITHT